MTALDGCQSRGVTEPQRDGGPLAVDEVSRGKVTLYPKLLIRIAALLR